LNFLLDIFFFQEHRTIFFYQESTMMNRNIVQKAKKK